MKQWELPVDELTKEVVGETQVILDGDRALVRRNETNLGNLLTDAIVNSVSDFEHEDLDGKIEIALSRKVLVAQRTARNMLTSHGLTISKINSQAVPCAV